MAPPFGELVGRLTEAFGQQMGAMRPVPEGYLLQTTDGFLYAFLEDPTKVSLNAIQRLQGEVRGPLSRLVVFSPGRLPLALTAEVARHGATVVDGARFKELVVGLDLGSYLGEEPRAATTPTEARQLPSARQLDEIITRARTWLDWGVPAVALRFFRQALDLKPEFAPAKNGVGRALMVLGLVEDAKRLFVEVLATSPDNLEARLGLAAVAGASGDPAEEVRIYRKLLEEDPERPEVRAHLIAAFVESGRWPEVEPELVEMLRRTPEDPRLRFLHGVALEKAGRVPEGEEERKRARALGLSYDAERSLCDHLGLPRPERPREATAMVVGPPPPPAPGPSARTGSPRRPAAPPRPKTRRKARPRRRSRAAKANAK